MVADLKVKGPQATIQRYLVAAGTAIMAGEPVHTVGMSWTTGATDVNTSVLAAADTPVVGTHVFRGVAIKNSRNVAAGTVKEQWLPCACPVPNVGRIVGRAETVASVDTLTEAALLVEDYTLIDYSATGASDSGELYTIKQAASANTSGLMIEWINTATQWIEASVASRAYRNVYS